MIRRITISVAMQRWSLQLTATKGDWSDHGAQRADSALRAHCSLIFGKAATDPGLAQITREPALKALRSGLRAPAEVSDATLPCALF